MKPKEKRQQEQEIREALEDFFGEAYKEADFCYYRGKKGVLVTYEDFKPEREVKEKVCELVGDGWNVVLKREFSDLTVMLTMLRLYKENRIAVVDVINGELTPYQVRVYVNMLMAEK